jgi:hypothetical protein
MKYALRFAMHECFNKIVSLLESNAYETEEKSEKKVYEFTADRSFNAFFNQRRIIIFPL